MSKRRHIARPGEPGKSLCGIAPPVPSKKRLCGTCARLEAGPRVLAIDDVVDARERFGRGGTGFGHGVVWTPERIEDALRAYVKRTAGMLPSGSDEYSAVKKGDPSLPVAVTVVERYGAISRAWLAVGAPKSRVKFLGDAWTEEEVEYLLEHAGNQTLKQIETRLHRSRAACRRKLYDLGLRARDAQGFMSAQQVAVEYGCGVKRVLTLIRNGELKAHHPAGKTNIWAVDPSDAKAVAHLLRAPKRTHRPENGYRTDFGDYRAHYGIRRTVLVPLDERRAS
ncbi:MAG: hypothetical protein AB7I38_11120 [Dehalococcoidia bacterium]